VKLLLLAATPPEIAPTVDYLRQSATKSERNVLHFPRVEITVLFGGLGILSTAYLLGHHFATPDAPSLAIQGGVAGAIDPTLALTSVVNVTSETLLDLGAEDRTGKLLTPKAMGLPLGHPFDEDGVLHPPGPASILPYPTVAGGTVNQTTGTQTTLDHLRSTFPGVQTESMEGAAFFYACMQAGVEPLQLRAISNYVGVRDRESWEMGGAIARLNEELINVLTPFL
jgi:futalosine hydrolase